MGGETTSIGFIFCDENGNLHIIMGVDTLQVMEIQGAVVEVNNNRVKHTTIGETILVSMAGNSLTCQLLFDAIKQTFEKVLRNCTPDQFAQKVHHILKGSNPFQQSRPNQSSLECGAIMGGWSDDTPFLIEATSISTGFPVVGRMIGTIRTLGSGGMYAWEVLHNRVPQNSPMNLRSAIHVAKIALTYAAHNDPGMGDFAKLFHSSSSTNWSCVSMESLNVLKSTYDVSYCERFRDRFI